MITDRFYEQLEKNFIYITFTNILNVLQDWKIGVKVELIFSGLESIKNRIFLVERKVKNFNNIKINLH